VTDADLERLEIRAAITREYEDLVEYKNGAGDARCRVDGRA
jgi:hypothetical protein